MCPCFLTEKRIQAFKTKCLMKILIVSYLEHKSNDWVQRKINFLVGPQEPLLATVKRWKLAWFGYVTCRDNFSRVMRRAPWSVGYAVVSRGNAGWTTPRSGHPCPCQNSQQLPAENNNNKQTGRRSLLICLSCPVDDPIRQGTELKSLLRSV